jgi:alpha-D-ribose 1-methylphosphonate 5-triphosphate synthase subunit PhnH
MEKVLHTQRLFRALMQAMSNPGMIVPVEKQPETTLLQSICETLLDHEVLLAVVGQGVDTNFINDIRMFCACRCVPIENADYVVVFGGSSGGQLINISVGTPEQPDRGATVIYPVDHLNARGRVKITLNGPGIRKESEIFLDGVDAQELELARQLNSRFPLGIDLLFCDSESVLALPRSTRMEITEEA